MSPVRQAALAATCATAAGVLLLLRRDRCMRFQAVCSTRVACMGSWVHAGHPCFGANCTASEAVFTCPEDIWAVQARAQPVCSRRFPLAHL